MRSGRQTRRGSIGRTTQVLVLAALVTLAGAGAAGAQDDGTFTDPAEAGIAYQMQGEYLGTIDDDSDFKVGGHVIALGDGKFKIRAYLGGLPGDGWRRGDDIEEANGELIGDQVVFTAEGGSAVLKDGVITIMNEDGVRLGELNKFNRVNPNLGMEPPEGAIVLFDGGDVDQFEDAELVDGQYLGATNCYTKQRFGDHYLHIEFRTPFMPAASGQARGNSGVYVQGRYEVQVLDSFGLEGRDNECGGIYQVAEPAVNMCLPPLVWQTYDIEFTAARYDDDGNKTDNARITVRHNGQVIHDNVELPNGTPGRHPEGPGPDALFLQDHGNPVVYRNIWVVER